MSFEEIPERIIRAKSVMQLTGLSKSETYRKANDPTDAFPAPVRLSDHAVGWYEPEVLAWRSERPRTVTKMAGANAA